MLNSLRNSPFGRRLVTLAEGLFRFLTPMGVLRTVDGERFRVDTRVRYLWNAGREPELRLFIREHLGADETVLDVGSHAGVYVLLFTRWSSRARVHAFEPNPATREVLARHIRFNGVGDRVTINRVAVSDRTGRATFFALPLEGMSRLGTANPEIAGRAVPLSVETVSVDDYCMRHAIAPTWLRVDVEGFEFAVLRGARTVIRRGRPGLRIVVEMHPSAWKDAGETPESARALLDDLGLEPIGLTGQRDPLADYGIVHLAYRP